MKIISAMFLIVGTYFLSISIFINNIQWLINIKYNDLPWYFKILIVSLCLKEKYISGKLWRANYAPTTDNFSWQQKSSLLQPYVGFIFISIGTLLSLIPSNA